PRRPRAGGQADERARREALGQRRGVLARPRPPGRRALPPRRGDPGDLDRLWPGRGLAARVAGAPAGPAGSGSAVPRRSDLRKILLIGSGPIVIGQACEFDYSGTQAVKALREEGFEVVLVNSNPATIMTDPEMAHRTYVEPLTPEFVGKIIER